MLLLSNADDPRLLASLTQKVRLTSLLIDLSTGHAPKKKQRPVYNDTISDPHGEVPVVLLRMGHFHPERDHINWYEINIDLDKPTDTNEADRVESRLIIQPGDLLMSLRGQPRVIHVRETSLNSMPEELRQLGLKLAPSNNFILLRPHTQLVYVPFLQMIFQMILEDLMEDWELRKSKVTGVGPMAGFIEDKLKDQEISVNSNVPFGARDLKDMVIGFPETIDKQQELHEAYLQLKKEELDLKIRLQSFRKNITHYSNPIIKP